MAHDSRQMTVDDLLTIMEANRGIYKEYDALPAEQKRFVAQLNIDSGTAEAFLDEAGIVVAVAGIRYIGIGEAWLITLPKERTPSLLRIVARLLPKRIKEKNLWRVFATSKISETFLRHLGFEKQEDVYTLTKVE